jgi:hypothetical protein
MTRISARRASRAIVATLVLAVVLMGCQKIVRPSVGASVSPCFRILPPAHQALGGQGTFVDVVRIRGRGVTLFPSIGTRAPGDSTGRAPLATSGGDSGAGPAGGGQAPVVPPPSPSTSPAPGPSMSPAPGPSGPSTTLGPSNESTTLGPSGPSTTLVGTTRDICVVAYKGAFDTSRIQHLTGVGRTGQYALVIVGVRAQLVRAVLLVDRLPAPLHAH